MKILDKYLPELVMAAGAAYVVLGIIMGGQVGMFFAPMGAILIGFAIYIRHSAGYGN